MTQEELSKLNDDELLEYSKRNKPSPLIDAFFIGFLIGIIIYSVASNSLGLVTLVPDLSLSEKAQAVGSSEERIERPEPETLISRLEVRQ